MVKILKPIPLTLATGALIAVSLILHSHVAPHPNQSTSRNPTPPLNRTQVVESTPSGTADFDLPELGTGQTYDREYGPAPCEECLDERQAIDIVTTYLQENDIQYLGELHAEIAEDFPWMGHGELSFAYDREPATWDEKLASQMIEPPRPIIYFAEHSNGLAVPRDDSQEDVTWRVSYQHGWIGFEYVEQEVDAGTIPIEALAWPPQKRERDVLVHARTRALKHLIDVTLE